MRHFCLTLLLLLLGANRLEAQLACPPNVDFEQGTLSNWTYRAGLNGGTYNQMFSGPSTPAPNRAAAVTGPGLDPVGGFPIIAPGGGLFALKLGNEEVWSQMDKVSYTFTIPTGLNNYNILYRYAIVMQNPAHTAEEQPFFKVVAYDSATGARIPCDSSTYVSSSNLPGFVESHPGSNIWYKDWTMTSLKMAGQAGKTIRLEFTVADCQPGAHYGYAYVDITCGLFRVTAANCNGSATTPLVGPPGFQNYSWYANNFGNYIGSGQTLIIPTPTTTTNYFVVLNPYPGYGCRDTLKTQIVYSTLSVNATPDSVSQCVPASVQLNTIQAGSAPPFSYNWSPALGLSCAYCPNPVLNPINNTNYVVSVTDSNGCTVTDTVKVLSPPIITTSQTNASCYGRPDGTATATIQGGIPPYTISWNTTPVQTTATATALLPGTYIVTVRDARNCSSTKTVVITSPPPIVLTGTATTVICRGVGFGRATVHATGSFPPFTYSWNTVPPQANDTAFNLDPGSYIATVSDQNGCTQTITQTVVETQPLVITGMVSRRSCPGVLNSEITTSYTGAHGPVAYGWNTIPHRTTPNINNIGAGTYIVEAQDSIGCRGSDTITVTDYPSPTVVSSPDIEICSGESTSLTASGASTYQWMPPVALSCITCTSTTANPTTTTTYRVVGKDNNGCPDTATTVVKVLEHTPTSVDSNRRICLGDKVMLNAYGGDGYNWTPAGTLLGALLPNPIASPASTTRYQVIVNINRCFADTLHQEVTVLPLPSVDIMDGFSGIPGAEVQLTTTNVNAASIKWAPLQGLSCYDCFNPIVTLDKTIVYLAEVTDSLGCKAVDTIRIVVGCDGSGFYMANTFTPNNDGKNDYFYPQALGINSVHRFMIYNRWGEIVFSATDMPVNVPERGWDGMHKGKEVPPDVFVYVIETLCQDGKPAVIKGDVTLVR